MKDYVAGANEYIRQVLAGEIVACKWTKLSCQRQLDDLARDWDYYFDEEAANTVCSFLELLTHVKGELGGKHFQLEGWQQFVVTTTFGWRRKADGRRRFRRMQITCGKSNGKSFLSSGLGLYMLCADEESGAEVVCAARATDQARLVFDVARDMLRANPGLCEAFGLQVLQHSIVQKTSASVMKPVSAQGKSLAGKMPHYASVDELWSHRDRIVLDEMERGVDKRVNSLLSSIGHAGENLASIGYEQDCAAKKILSGELKDDRTFCVIYNAEGFDWTSDDALQAANPNLGISVYADTLREARDRAVSLPALQSAFKSHNLCLWEGSASVWLPGDKLAACRERGLKMADFRCWHIGEHPGVSQPNQPRPFVLGIDLASRQDLASIVFCTTGFLNGVQHWYFFSRNYLPTDTVATSPVAQYRGWARRGLLITHPGGTNDYNAIQEDILGMYRKYVGYGTIKNADGYNFAAVAYDSWQADQLKSSLEGAGIQPIAFPKNAKTYSPVMDWFSAMCLEGRIHFPADDDVLYFCLTNVECKRDNNDNVFPLKAGKDPTRKIDAAVAALYASRLAMADNGRLLAAPVSDGVRVTFFCEDGTVKQSDGKGGLVEVPRRD